MYYQERSVLQNEEALNAEILRVVGEVETLHRDVQKLVESWQESCGVAASPRQTSGGFPAASSSSPFALPDMTGFKPPVLNSTPTDTIIETGTTQSSGGNTTNPAFEQTQTTQPVLGGGFPAASSSSPFALLDMTGFKPPVLNGTPTDNIFETETTQSSGGNTTNPAFEQTQTTQPVLGGGFPAASSSSPFALPDMTGFKPPVLNGTPTDNIFETETTQSSGGNTTNPAFEQTQTTQPVLGGGFPAASSSSPFALPDMTGFKPPVLNGTPTDNIFETETTQSSGGNTTNPAFEQTQTTQPVLGGGFPAASSSSPFALPDMTGFKPPVLNGTPTDNIFETETTQSSGGNTTNPAFEQTQTTQPVLGDKTRRQDKKNTGGAAFGQPKTSFVFGATQQSKSLFWQPLFGQPSTQSASGLFVSTPGFGATAKVARQAGGGTTGSSNVFGALNLSNSLFGKPAGTATPFGAPATTTTNTLGLNNTSTNLLGSNTAQKPFGNDELERRQHFSPTSKLAKEIGTSSHKVQLMKASFFDHGDFNIDDELEKRQHFNPTSKLAKDIGTSK